MLEVLSFFLGDSGDDGLVAVQEHLAEILAVWSSDEDLHNFSRKDRTVAFYARRQCLSEKHFSRMVKKASGRKPMDIIREYVILDAKSLLLTGLYSVKEIAEKLGFINNSFFSRYFRLSTPQTPLEFLRGSEE